MKLIFALALMCMGSASAAAQSFLPAEELVQEALDTYPSISAAKARVSAAQSDARGLAASPYEWTLTGGYTQRVIENKFGFNEFDAQLTKGFRRRGKASLDREIGSLGVEAAQLSSADMRHQVALELATLWIEWLSKEEQLSIKSLQVESFTQSLDVVRRRLNANDASKLDYELAEAALAEAKSAFAKSRGDAQIAKRRLEAMFPDLPLPPTAPRLSDPGDFGNPGHWKDLIVKRSHEIELAETQARHASAIARRSRLNLKPDFEAGLRTFSERNGDEVGLGVVVSIPLGGPRRSAAADSDSARASMAMAELTLKRRELEAVAQNDITIAQSSRLAWQGALEAKQASEASITRLRRGYELGDTDLSDLLIAERRHVDVIDLEASARARSAYAYVRLRIDGHDLWIGHASSDSHDRADTGHND